MFSETETVHNVLRKLADNKHNGFPVLSDRPDGRRVFVGLVLRNQVYTLIAEQHFVGGQSSDTPGGSGSGRSDALNEGLLGSGFDDGRTREALYNATVLGEGEAAHRSKVPQLIER
jgi:hypothetical protein